MKILFFNYEYPPLGGGAAKATFYILEEFSKIPDLEVDLVTSSPTDQLEILEISKSIRVHRLPIGKNGSNYHFQSQKDLLVYAWKAYWYAAKMIKDGGYDLTHSFFTVPCGFLSLIFKYQFKLPYIISLRGSDVPGYSERFSFLYVLLTPLIRFIWKKSAAVIANSQGLRDLALKTDPARQIGVIYNGIRADKFAPASGEPSATDEFNIISTSPLTERKGINYLIEAAAMLAEKYPTLRLRIIGDGDAKEKLEAQAEKLKIGDKVKFFGLLDHNQMPEIYASSQVFVLPSLNEGMSNTMLEALASGLPLIATDTGGTKELVKDGENGHIIKMKDARDIAEKIERLIVDPGLRIRMGKNSRQRALEMSWENVAKEYQIAYQKAANHK